MQPLLRVLGVRARRERAGEQLVPAVREAPPNRQTEAHDFGHDRGRARVGPKGRHHNVEASGVGRRGGHGRHEPRILQLGHFAALGARLGTFQRGCRSRGGLQRWCSRCRRRVRHRRVGDRWRRVGPGAEHERRRGTRRCRRGRRPVPPVTGPRERRTTWPRPQRRARPRAQEMRRSLAPRPDAGARGTP